MYSTVPNTVGTVFTLSSEHGLVFYISRWKVFNVCRCGLKRVNLRQLPERRKFYLVNCQPTNFLFGVNFTVRNCTHHICDRKHVTPNHLVYLKRLNSNMLSLMWCVVEITVQTLKIFSTLPILSIHSYLSKNNDVIKAKMWLITLNKPFCNFGLAYNTLFRDFPIWRSSINIKDSTKLCSWASVFQYPIIWDINREMEASAYGLTVGKYSHSYSAIKLYNRWIRSSELTVQY